MIKSYFRIFLTISVLFFGQSWAEDFDPSELNKLRNALLKELDDRKGQIDETQEKTNDDSKALFPAQPSTYLDQDLATEVLSQAPEEIGQVIVSLINPLLLGKDTPKQLLLVGPPGTGKSTLAQAIARETNRRFTFIHAPSLVNEYVHSGAANLRRAFDPLLKSNKPHILIIDEMTCLTDQYKNEKGDSLENATALWLLLDECRQKDNIFFIGITNDATKMPAQMKSRFLGNVVEIPLPSLKAKRKIFNFLLSKSNTYFDLENNQKFLDTFIKKTADYSIREIEAVIALAKRYTIKNLLDNNVVLTPILLEKARLQIELQKNKILDFGAEQDTLTEKLHKETFSFNKNQAKISLFFSIFGTSLSVASFVFSLYQWHYKMNYKINIHDAVS